MASDYNPNSIWSSKERKYEYDAPSRSAPKTDAAKTPLDKKSSTPTGDNNSGGSDNYSKKLTLAIVLGVVVLGFLGFMYYLLKPAPAQNVELSFSDPGQVL